MSTIPAVDGSEGVTGAGVAPASPSRCPIDQTARAAAPDAVTSGGCPVRHDGQPVQRSRADRIVRSALRIQERPAGVSDAAAYATFQRSMLISATRCTLTYVIFPFVLPAIGIATGVGPILGVVIGVIAMTCDVFTIRRFFQVDHRWRWQISAIAVCVISLLSVLLVEDIGALISNGPFG